jgi:hypothetical protein
MQENNRVAGTDTDVGHATVKYVDVFLARRGGTALLMFADHDTFFELIRVGGGHSRLDVPHECRCATRLCWTPKRTDLRGAHIQVASLDTKCGHWSPNSALVQREWKRGQQWLWGISSTA